MKRRVARWILAVSVILGLVMPVSGGWSDPWLWAYVTTWAAVSLYGLLSLDEDLARERFHPPEPGADYIAVRVIRAIALAHLVVGALDAGRFHWTSVPAVLRVTGLIGMALSGFLMFHAMHSNHFFSAVVRIQSERGHKVIDRGPYATIRHPGYAGMMLIAPMSGLALGSWLSVGLALTYSVLILRRVFFEDAFLRRNLEGYEAYAARVRYRLVPRVF